MDYNQIENILLSYGLRKGNVYDGTYSFQYVKGKKHKIIFERLRPLKNGGAGGYLYAVVLDEYKHRCSKNGHLCLSKIKSEYEFKNILERVIAYFNSNY